MPTRYFAYTLIGAALFLACWKSVSQPSAPSRPQVVGPLVTNPPKTAPTNPLPAAAQTNLVPQKSGPITNALVTPKPEELLQRIFPVGQEPSRATKPRTYGAYKDEAGRERQFRQGVLLIKTRGSEKVGIIEVPDGAERKVLQQLQNHPEVEFVELDHVAKRFAAPNDPHLGISWHHEKIGSANAWETGFATHRVKLAIVDYPFQMTHPDLAANTLPGWDVPKQRVITSTSSNDWHSTQGAGLAAAVANNGLLGLGVSNCHVLPVNIDALISDMYRAIIWCAENGVRVVNISWDGCDDRTLNDAAGYLRSRNEGLVFMAGINFNSEGRRARLNLVNQPNILAISATDRDDRSQTSWGPHIDFSAPGWRVYAATSGGQYTFDDGSSFSAPVAAGVAAFLMSINPDLGGAEIVEILKQTAFDAGLPGVDEEHGFGRIDFGRAAQLARASSPYFTLQAARAGQNLEVSTRHFPGSEYQLEQRTLTGSWNPADILASTNETTLSFQFPLQEDPRLFRLRLHLP